MRIVKVHADASKGVLAAKSPRIDQRCASVPAGGNSMTQVVGHLGDAVRFAKKLYAGASSLSRPLGLKWIALDTSGDLAMYRLRRVSRALRFVVLIGGCWATGAAQAWAQLPIKPADQGTGSAYTLPYFLVLMGVILGLIFVLRPSNRRERERPAQYQEKKVMTDE
jgi:hypothetical protein